LIPKLRVRKKKNRWWIVGDLEDGPYGPYDVYKEAREDCVGLLAFFKAVEEEDQEFFTVDPVKKKTIWNHTNTKRK